MIEKVVALLVVQDNVDEPPEEMLPGDAVRVQVGAGDVGVGVTTVTVALQVAVPPGPVTVPVAVTEAVGVTLADPPAISSAPTALSTTNEVALEVVQVRVVD